MKIEVGKRYWTRDGRLSGVVSLDPDPAGPYQFLADIDGMRRYYCDDGLLFEKHFDPRDLIKEYVEPAAEIPGLEGYRVVRYGKVKKGELYLDSQGIREWLLPDPSEGKHLIVEKLAPAKRTIVLKETFNRYGNRWSLDWLTEGNWPDELVPPDEQIYTGNERTVEV